MEPAEPASGVPRARRRTFWRVVLVVSQLALTAVAFEYLLKTVSPSQVRDALAGAAPLTLTLGFLVYAVMTVGRTARFKRLGAEHVRWLDLLGIVWVHNLANNILPMRVGEAVYPLLAKRVGNLGIGTSTGAVIVSRLGDFAALVATTLVSLWIAGNPLPLPAWQITACLLCAGLAPLVVVLAGPRILGAVLAAFDQRKSTFAWRKANELRVLLASVPAGRFMGSIFAWSMFIQGAGSIANYLTFRALGLELSFWQSNIALTASFLMAILPIQPVGGWGVFEATVVGGLGLYGFQTAAALRVAITIHVIGYVFFTLLGAAGLALLAFSRSARAPENPAPFAQQQRG